MNRFRKIQSFIELLWDIINSASAIQSSRTAAQLKKEIAKIDEKIMETDALINEMSALEKSKRARWDQLRGYLNDWGCFYTSREIQTFDDPCTYDDYGNPIDDIE